MKLRSILALMILATAFMAWAGQVGTLSSKPRRRIRDPLQGYFRPPMRLLPPMSRIASARSWNG